MASVPPFQAGIVMNEQHKSQLVSERVALRSLTHKSKLRTDTTALGQQRDYKYKILEGIQKACPNKAAREQITARFLNLAESLEYAKGVAIPTEKDAVDEAEGRSLQSAWRELLNDNTAYGGRSLSLSAEVLQQHSTFRGLLHPLVVALLAYRMGGPINAANTGYAHQWKRPDHVAAPTDMRNFHMEGDNGEPTIFDVQRLALVWGEHEGIPTSVCGEHNIFRSGQGCNPERLKTASLINPDNAEAPSWIMYDPQNSALSYDCIGSNVVRHCISLDFQVHTIPDDMIDLLAAPGAPTIDSKRVTLTDLLLSFPISSYHNHFLRLLFSPESVQAIIAKLSTIDMPATLRFATSDPNQLFQQRVEAYHRKNIANIPADILQFEHEICLTGTYMCPDKFLERLYLKARREMYLPLGCDIIPQDIIEENREYARTLIRTLPGDMVCKRLARYAHTLTEVPFTEQDLLPVKQLQQVADSIEKRCLAMVGKGYMDNVCALPSMASFAAALHTVLGSPKEADATSEPLVTKYDMQIFRTRCMYLFWCADWLENFYAHPLPGPHMVNVLEIESALKMWRGEIGHISCLLLRNWVALGLVMERLPKGAFCVKKAT
jgi:hypothetical protein